MLPIYPQERLLSPWTKRPKAEKNWCLFYLLNMNVRLVSLSLPLCTARRCPVTHDPHSGHWPALVSGLSDVSPQQNDNEIYNAAFSLSHNLRIPTLLQPSPHIRDRHPSFRLKHTIFTQDSFDIWLFMSTLIKSLNYLRKLWNIFFKSSQHSASLFQITQHTRGGIHCRLELTLEQSNEKSDKMQTEYTM